MAGVSVKCRVGNNLSETFQNSNLFTHFIKRNNTMATTADSVCYTLINVQTDNESINEVSLRNDLGEFFKNGNK